MPGCNILLRFPALPLFLFNRELLMLSRSSYHARPTVKYVVLTICKHKAFFSTWYDLHKEHNCCFVAYLIMTGKSLLFYASKVHFLGDEMGYCLFWFPLFKCFHFTENKHTDDCGGGRQTSSEIGRKSL